MKPSIATSMCVRVVALTMLTMSVAGSLTRMVSAQSDHSPYGDVLAALGYPGDFGDGVLRIDLPRREVVVTCPGVTRATPFPVDGWVAMTKADGDADLLLGELVLFENEVNAVLSASIDNALEVTALHHHVCLGQPRLVYMQLRDHGPAAQLANRLKPVLDLITKNSSRVSRGTDRSAASLGRHTKPAVSTSIDTRRLADIVGHEGKAGRATYEVTIGRVGLDVHAMGATMNSRMGLNTTAVLTGTRTRAVIGGRIALFASEVAPVLKALGSSGIEVVSLDQLTSDTQSPISLVHYWGVGTSEKLARGLRAVLDVLDKPATARP